MKKEKKKNFLNKVKIENFSTSTNNTNCAEAAKVNNMVYHYHLLV
jgi:cytidine deaminase